MRIVIWEDETGWKRRALLPDGLPDAKAAQGVQQNPPDVRGIDVEGCLREVNNLLTEEGLLTWTDVNLNQAVFQRACNVFRKHLIGLFRQKEDTHGE